MKKRKTLFDEALSNAAMDTAREMGYKSAEDKLNRSTVKHPLSVAISWVQSTLKELRMSKSR